MSRQPREGFWQETVFSFFGFYPWECTHCRVEKLMHNRGVRVRIKKPIEEQASPQS